MRTGDPWIQVRSGKVIYLLNPKPDDILLTDIAHALSNICRFGGHSDFISVAQHSVMVSRYVSPINAMWGLMHDASEAYLGDVPRPVKYYEFMGEYRRLERIFMRVICERFDLPPQEPAEVGWVDDIVLVTERRDVCVDQEIDWGIMRTPLKEIVIPMAPRQARWAFIERFLEINGRRLA